MYDIIFIGDKNFHHSAWKEFKTKFPTLKNASTLEDAKRISITKMFWVLWPDIILEDSFDFSYTADQWDSGYVHVFKNNQSYDGVCLIPKSADVTEKELQHRFFRNKKEVDIVASRPRSFDYFEVDSYDDYLHALQNSNTEMFWISSKNISPVQFIIKNFYISHHDSQLRNQTHAFIHKVKDQRLYNGLFLCSKRKELARREVEYRFPVDRIEHNVIGSVPKTYDVFEIDSYEEYLHALENSTTEMFWMSSRNISVTIPDVYFTYDNEYDRKQNHAFIHRVNDTDYYNGLFLCSKHVPLSKKEIEYRHPVNRKEWDIVASGPKKYDIFEIDSYDEYLSALENSTTEMFWMSSRNISATIPDLYFTHDNKFDRTHNHNFLHCGNKRNGLFLCSKHVPLTKREVEYRFVVNAKEWDIEASDSKKYDVFEIDSYEEYLAALENSTTEMFWMSSRNISATIPDLYFTHDNEFDRKQNHAFIHSVNNQKLYNGLFLCSKHLPLTEKEIEYRHPVNRKEWDIVASGPVNYDIFKVDTYEEYLYALENSKTEMFWSIPSTIDLDPSFKFDLYFTHDNRYDRRINHVFLNGKYHDGVILCSKRLKISAREWHFKFISGKKEYNIVASTPKPYDVVFISYAEPNADENYENLKRKVPNAKRVHGVKGIHQAHIEAAKLCSTPMLWIVDGDAEIVNEFNFDYQVPAWQYNHVHVWRSKNPINGLVYGYGGIKLFPRQLTLDMDISKPDMTTSISDKFVAIKEISNITGFNTGEFETWKSAFRECCKLAAKVIDRQKDDETDRRLKIWCSVGRDKPFGEYAIAGAKAGMVYGSANKDNVEALKKINDFDWLKEQFNGNL